MKKLIVFAIAALLALSVRGEKVSLVGGTVINPADGRVIENAVLVINGDKIESVASRKETGVPVGSRWVDCTGKFILPGYIDTHIHFFQSGALFTRPDAADFTKIRPYADEVAWIKSHLNDVFARYLRCGITSVVDVGGPMWNFEVRKVANSTAKAPRVAVAGPLISSVSRPQLNLGDPPIVQVNTPEDARAMVRTLAAKTPDYIKIWFIVDPEHPLEKFRPIVHAVVDESHARKLRVAVHATELEAARTSVEEGADLLVHSVTDKPVDDAFVRLLKDKGTILCPTLVVFERYGRTFANKVNLTPEEKAWGNPEVIASLDVTKIPPDQLPDRVKKALENPDSVLDRIQHTYDVALKNLKILEDAGIPIAAGTDAGNIGTIHGPALFREFQLMRDARLTPMQILRCATSNAARVFATPRSGVLDENGNPQIGSIIAGSFADLIILNSNPAADIARASDIDRVIKNGTVYDAASLLPK